MQAFWGGGGRRPSAASQGDGLDAAHGCGEKQEGVCLQLLGLNFWKSDDPLLAATWPLHVLLNTGPIPHGLCSPKASRFPSHGSSSLLSPENGNTALSLLVLITALLSESQRAHVVSWD